MGNSPPLTVARSISSCSRQFYFVLIQKQSSAVSSLGHNAKPAAPSRAMGHQIILLSRYQKSECSESYLSRNSGDPTVLGMPLQTVKALPKGRALSALLLPVSFPPLFQLPSCPPQAPVNSMVPSVITPARFMSPGPLCMILSVSAGCFLTAPDTLDPLTHQVPVPEPLGGSP